MLSGRKWRFRWRRKRPPARCGTRSCSRGIRARRSECYVPRGSSNVSRAARSGRGFEQESGFREMMKRGLGFLASPFLRACLALILILIFGSIFNGNGAFFRRNMHVAVMQETATYGILATGMTLVIISGGIDL